MSSHRAGISTSFLRLANTSVDNVARGPSLSADESFIRNRTGFARLARLGRESILDLADDAVRGLLETENLATSEIGAVAVVSQNPSTGGLPHMSALLHARLELPPDCSVFDVGLGCSGFVHSAALLTAFMDAQRISNAVLVTADAYSPWLDGSDRSTELLFGDGAAATLLTSDGPSWQLTSTDFVTASSRSSALSRTDDGLISMNGRAVFDFAAKQVPPSIERALERAGCGKSEIDLFLLHQGSRYIVETIAARMGVVDRAPFLAADYGNLVSSSIPAMLSDPQLALGERMVICGFGVGLAVATAVLERTHGD